MMAHSQSDSFLLKFTTDLKNLGRLPKNIEVCNLQSGVMASVFEDVPTGAISESVFCGMDPDPATAVLKGLVEMVERQAYREGFERGLSSCKTERSDGFAAFPIGGGSKAKEIVRQNALHEAVERFAWATWWDDPTIAHSKRQIDFNRLSIGQEPLLDLDEMNEIASVFEIRPKIEGNFIVILYFAFLNPFGVISGGACEAIGEVETTKYRALNELLRHGIALRKIKEKGQSPRTFYESRLAYFGLAEEGSRLVKERLNQIGHRFVVLPELQIDSEIPHSLSNLVTVHRCYFENQPPFVGGKLERLCL